MCPSLLRLLAVRISSDEAAGALIASQFFVWLFRKTWWCLSPIWERFERLRRAVGPWFAFILAGAALGAWLGIIPGKSAEMARVGVPAFLMASGVATMIVGLAAYVVLVLIVLMHVPVGLDAMLASLHVLTAAEPTPPGQATVFHVAPRDVSPTSGLRHSALYDDPEVISFVASWIGARVAGDGVRLS